jgi:hypothetical protein
MIKNIYIGLHVQCRLFLSDFNETLIFLTDFRKMFKISNSMKILLVETKFLHVDGRTDMTKPIVAFRKIVKAPINKQRFSGSTDSLIT